VTTSFSLVPVKKKSLSWIVDGLWWPVGQWCSNVSLLTAHLSSKFATLRESRRFAHRNSEDNYCEYYTYCILNMCELKFILNKIIYKFLLPATISKFCGPLLCKPFDYHRCRPYVMVSATRIQSAKCILCVCY
jgi:hypothetical protein